MDISCRRSPPLQHAVVERTSGGSLCVFMRCQKTAFRVFAAARLHNSRALPAPGWRPQAREEWLSGPQW
jgi:hypothetical protein